MNWITLLSTERLHHEEPEPRQFADYPINDFEKDYNRIVSSAVFRRLQDKTQVFPLDKSDFVRTRLTHSIEVSTIARQLGIMISKNTTPYKPSDINAEMAESLSSVLLCAGLLHDLGNPPFGHFGEVTIAEWFKKNLDTIHYKNKSLRETLAPHMVKDLENFEGNAQALRILAKSRYNSEVNLSKAIISTLIKYPTDSMSFDQSSNDIKKHKPGYYFAEKDTFSLIAQTVGTQNSQGEVYRHPLTFLLEAADDIAYATADLEDGLKKNLFSLSDFIFYFNSENVNGTSQQYSNLLIEDLIEKRKNAPDDRAFSSWIVYVRRWLMHVAVYRFSRSYTDIMNGTYKNDLFYRTNHAQSIKILKGAMSKFVFDSPSILKLELSSQTILSFLLDKFVNSILYYDYADNDYKPTKADKKFISLLSDNYKQDYESSKTHDESADLYLRLLIVTDFISGMTDSYARTLYRELSGIE